MRATLLMSKTVAALRTRWFSDVNILQCSVAFLDANFPTAENLGVGQLPFPVLICAICFLINNLFVCFVEVDISGTQRCRG